MSWPSVVPKFLELIIFNIFSFLNYTHSIVSCFEDVRLVEELDCFLVLKGLMLFDLNAKFNKMVVRDLIRFPDVPKLAAKLVLFQPTKYEGI